MRALIVLLLLAGAARADVHHEVVVGSQIRALRTSSANALTDESLVGPALGYAYRLPLDVLPKLQLWGTAGFLGGLGDGEMFQTLTTHISTLQMTGGVRARYDLWRGIVVANARVDLGAQRVDVSLEDMDDHVARDSSWGAVSTAALGVELNGLALRSFGIGLRFEYGYTVTQSVDLNARSNGAPEDTLELDRMAASLGHLDLGGRYLSFTVSSRF